MIQITARIVKTRTSSSMGESWGQRREERYMFLVEFEKQFAQDQQRAWANKYQRGFESQIGYRVFLICTHIIAFLDQKA